MNSDDNMRAIEKARQDIVLFQASNSIAYVVQFVRKDSNGYGIGRYCGEDSCSFYCGSLTNDERDMIWQEARWRATRPFPSFA